MVQQEQSESSVNSMPHVKGSRDHDEHTLQEHPQHPQHPQPPQQTSHDPIISTIQYRRFYLSSLSFIFFLAFSSYLLQYEGLLSSCGLEPSARLVSHYYPKLIDWLQKMYYEVHQAEKTGDYRNADYEYGNDIDLICEFIAVMGIILSLIGTSRLFHHGLLFLYLTLSYTFLVQLGGTFYSFQWDILLIEVGWVTSICYAPWWLGRNSVNPTTTTATTIMKDKHNHDHERIIKEYDPVGAIPLRFLLFKLMLMSGVVKIQSQCPTWLNLTALEYHFATQPLPTSLSWYAHQLPPFILRLSVAMTLLIEIPLTILLILPDGIYGALDMTRWRRWGAMLQITLQILIMSSGNYNFFNLLTVALCIPCLDHGSKAHYDDDGNNVDRDDILRENDDDLSTIEKLGVFSIARRQSFQIFLFFIFVGWCFNALFELSYYVDVSTNEQFRDIKLLVTDVDQMISDIVPFIISAVILQALWSGLRYYFWTTPRSVSSSSITATIFARGKGFFHTMVCIVCICITSVPLSSLTPQLSTSTVITKASPLYQQMPFGFSNSYGLFRRMTGVGAVSGQYQDTIWGWNGLPPSIVERPEIILEGFFQKEQRWRELKFRWKPGDVLDAPKIVAPYQPRLDWQMWFAALGDYGHNPWLINLIHKLLIGCTPVIQLLDEQSLITGEDHLSAIRAKLYAYDFTRLDTDWAQKIPNTTILSWNMKLSQWHHDTLQFEGNEESQWWTRSFLHDYIPVVVEKGNPSVSSFLSANGYKEPQFDCNRNDDITVCDRAVFQKLCRISRQIHQIVMN